MGFPYCEMAAAGPHVVADCGYQTPDELNRPSYFSAAPEGASASAPALSSPVRRPAFVPHPSYGPVLPSDSGPAASDPQPHSNGHTPDNLDSRMEKGSSKRSPNGRVGLRDRIVCHTWTWFTMVLHILNSLFTFVD